MEKPLTFGFLVNDVLSSYQARLTLGLEQAAARRGARLLVFSGGYLSPSPDKAGFHGSFLFTAARKPAVDGLVVEGSILATEVGVEAVAQLCLALDVPVVSLGELPGLTSVTPCQDSGIAKLVDHLVVVHHRRRLAFISGPRGNSSSDAREAAFRRALEVQGLPVLERHLLHGTFLEHSGFEAIEILAAQGELEQIDGIVAANDLMALGAMAALEARNIEVPHHIAVVGFDDDEVAAAASPPLTTVRQPIDELSERAVELLTAQLRSVNVAARTEVPVELVVRQSCGCVSDERHAPPTSSTFSQRKRAHHPSYELHRFVQLSHMLRLLGGTLGTVEATAGVERLLRVTLPYLGLSTCGVFLFSEEPSTSVPPTEVRIPAATLVARHHEPAIRDAMHRGVPDLWRVLTSTAAPASAPASSTVRLSAGADWTDYLPAGADRPNLIVHPLSFADDALGFVAFSLPLHIGDAWLLEGIAGHLSGAIANLRAREKLKEATERAEAASTAKSEFLAIVSHELRTPLTAVLGHLDLAMKAAREAPLRQRLELAHSSARALLRSVNDVLDFSKLEASRVEVESVAFHFEEIFSQLLDTCGLVVAKKGLELVFDIDPEIPGILVGDPLRLTQILVNLLSNATKFSRTGRIVVGLELLEQHADDSVTLCFSVTDAGIGMSPAQLANLFQPFVQGDNSTTRRYGGTGLGLAICQRLTHLLGCEMVASSVQGQGSRFSFCPTLLAPRELATAFTEPTAQLVLLVEPDAEQARAVSSMLTGLGHRVYWAADDETARRVIRENEAFDVCFAGNSADAQGLDALWSALCKPGCDTPTLVRLLPLGGDRSTALGESPFPTLCKPPLPSQLRALCRKKGASTPESGLMLLGRRLLLVQDNPMSRDVLCAMLSSFGARVVAVETGSAAMREGENGAFEAILMDFNLPDMNGCEATRRIREAGYQLPILAVTADRRESVRQACLAAGMNDCLVTPLPASELCGSIAQWLGAPVARRSAVLSPRSGGGGPSAPAVFDAGLGLQHVGGNADVYRGLLKRFIDYQRALGEAALTTLPVDRALALVHGLVSASGNVGAARLCAKAQELEVALRGNTTVTPADWAELERIWQETRDAVSRHLGAAGHDADAAIPSATEASSLAALRRALKEHDTAALDVLPASLRLLRRYNPSHVVLRFEGAVRAYDFEGSLALLDGLSYSESTA